MAIQNLLEYAKIFQASLDRQVVAQATTGWMELNANLVRYNGGDEVKIPKIDMDALGNYDRVTGFVDGAVSLTWETRKLTMDRGRQFNIDEMDVDETMFIPTAAEIMGEFQRTKVIPEIDAYRYSKIASEAIARGKARTGYVPDKTTVLDALRQDIYSILDVAGDADLVITMATPVYALFESSPELVRYLDVTSFTQGNVEMRVRSYDGYPIIRVPSQRMYTQYVFYDGKTAGQEKGGFEPTKDPTTGAVTAKKINWIIAARNAVIAVSKTEAPRFFSPQENQRARAWLIDYRKYHDLWILDNQFELVRVNTQ